MNKEKVMMQASLDKEVYQMLFTMKGTKRTWNEFFYELASEHLMESLTEDD